MKILSDKDRLHMMQRKTRQQAARIMKLEAMLDYISMMADVELPEENMEEMRHEPEVC